MNDMIQKISLLHYPKEETYNKICNKFNIDIDKGQNKSIEFKSGKISKISLFNIKYKDYGHIWFLDITLDFPKFNCQYSDFEKELYLEYNNVFGSDIVCDFPKYDQLNCYYIEYSSFFNSKNPEDIIKKLSKKCVPQQLDKEQWDKFKMPHGTIEFCLSIHSDSIETLARCHGTALKKRIADKSLHVATGILPSAVINKHAENEIVGWLLKKYNIAGELI